MPKMGQMESGAFTTSTVLDSRPHFVVMIGRAFDNTGTNLTSVQVNGRLIPGIKWGAKLVIATATPFAVCVDDTGGTYAATALGDLHGGLNSRLDVVLYPLPKPVAGGTGAATPISNIGSLRRLVNGRVGSGQWDPVEGMAVNRLIDSVLYVSLLPRRNARIGEHSQRWVDGLLAVGLDIAPLLLEQNIEIKSGPSGPGTSESGRSRHRRSSIDLSASQEKELEA
jgi:hypothetical protein